jgi:uncharacterized metal-binding protein YceD (DUF177 family)
MQKSNPPLDPIEIDVTRLPTKGRRVKFDASKSELQAIAGSFNLLNVETFSAELHLTTWRRDGVKVEGTLQAKIEQSCVVSFETVAQNINENISLIYVPEGSPFAKPEIGSDGELVLDPEGADLPDTFDGTTINISQVLLEVFVLTIDPHPRAEGVNMDEMYNSDEESDDRPPSPFAVLAQLKNGKAD